ETRRERDEISPQMSELGQEPWTRKPANIGQSRGRHGPQRISVQKAVAEREGPGSNLLQPALHASVRNQPDRPGRADLESSAFARYRPKSRARRPSTRHRRRTSKSPAVTCNILITLLANPPSSN